jgi:tight adherence protein B
VTAAGLAAVLGGLAVLSAGGPPGRWATREPGRRRRRPLGRGVQAGEAGLAAVLHSVAAQLRAGVEPGAAWAAALGQRPATTDALGVALRTTAQAGGGGARRSARRPAAVPASAARRADDARSASRALAAVAAVRVADELGAPLAPALERIAHAVALDEEDEADVRAAIAGPRASARLLGWLPLLGAAVAAALGSDPVRVVLGGGLGTFAAVTGGVLTAVGRWWSGRLVRGVAHGSGP